jgi:hypothetical protein
MATTKLKLFPASQVSRDLLRSGTATDAAVEALAYAEKTPTVPREVPVWQEINASTNIENLVFGAIASGELPFVDSNGNKLPLPTRPAEFLSAYVTVPDVNALLLRAGYRRVWNPKVSRATRKPPSQRISWKLRVQQEATAMCLRLYANGANPSVIDLADSMAHWCVQNKVVAERGKSPSRSYIRMHVLGGQHWNKPVKP